MKVDSVQAPRGLKAVSKTFLFFSHTLLYRFHPETLWILQPELQKTSSPMMPLSRLSSVDVGLVIEP